MKTEKKRKNLHCSIQKAQLSVRSLSVLRSRMDKPNAAGSKSEIWVKKLVYIDVNNWDLETCRTFLSLNPKLQKLLVRPSNVTLSQVKSLVAISLYKTIIRNPYGRTSTRDFDNLVINTLNCQINIIRQLTVLRPPYMHLKMPQAFHDDLDALFYYMSCQQQALLVEQQSKSSDVQASSTAGEQGVSETANNNNNNNINISTDSGQATAITAQPLET